MKKDTKKRKKRRRKLPNGFGSITELANGRFWARITIGIDLNGKPIRIPYGTYDTYNQAYNAIIDYHEKNYNLDFNKINVEKLFYKSLEWKMRKYKDKPEEGKKTYSRYTSTFKNYYKPLYKKVFINLYLNDIQNIIDLCPHGYDTKSNIRLTYNMMYDYAKINRAKLPEKFTQYLELGEQQESTLHSNYLLDEIKLLWDNIDIPNVDLALIMIYTGLRPSELCKIETVNVFLDQQYMIGGIKTKAGKNRIIPLCDKIMPLIRKLYNENNKYLVLNQKMGPDVVLSYQSLKDRLEVVYRKLKLNRKPHDGRHTLETLLSEKAVSEVVIDAIMGHKQKGIGNKVYNHISLERKLNAVNLLNDLC